MPTTDPSFAIIEYVSWGAGPLAKVSCSSTLHVSLSFFHSVSCLSLFLTHIVKYTWRWQNILNPTEYKPITFTLVAKDTDQQIVDIE